MRNTVAKKIRKGVERKGLSRADYQAHKEVYKELNKPFKKKLQKITRAAKNV